MKSKTKHNSVLPSTLRRMLDGDPLVAYLSVVLLMLVAVPIVFAAVFTFGGDEPTPAVSAVESAEVHVLRTTDIGGFSVTHTIVEHPIFKPVPANDTHPLGGGIGHPERIGSWYEKCTATAGDGVDCEPIEAMHATDLLGR